MLVNSFTLPTVLSILATHHDFPEIEIAAGVIRWALKRKIRQIEDIFNFFDMSKISPTEVCNILQPIFQQSHVPHSGGSLTKLFQLSAVAASPTVEKMYRFFSGPWGVVLNREHAELFISSEKAWDGHRSIILDNHGFTSGVHSWKVEILETCNLL